jgi:5'-3' exonuclease
VFGFVGFLLGLLERAGPRHVAVAFDHSLTTSFRNEIYPAYKAQRELPPPELEAQFVHCRAFVDALGLTGLAHEAYEADDLIGSVLAQLRTQEFRAVVVTGDKDLAQLIGIHDQLWDPGRADPFGPDGVATKVGVRPDQIADFLALTGDAVDNIPGVPGIGPKTAVALLGHFGTLDALLERVEEIPFMLRLRGAAATAARLRQHRDLALLSRRLTGIALDAPVPLAPEHYAVRAPERARLEELCDRMKFGPLTRRRIGDYAARFAS